MSIQPGPGHIVMRKTNVAAGDEVEVYPVTVGEPQPNAVFAVEEYVSDLTVDELRMIVREEIAAAINGRVRL